MRRNPSAPWLHLAALFLLAFGSPTHAATSCAAGNPDTTSVVETTPTSDFTVNGDGTVTHAKTGLMWKQCAEGLSGAACADRASTVTVPSSSAPIIATTMTWANALNAAKTANAAAFAGYTDWRLPNKKELESIVESCGTEPSINQTVFPNTPAADFWSATSYVMDPTIAWDIYFGWGTTRYFSTKTTLFNVRLVRGGQSVDSFDLLNPTPAPTPISQVVEFYNTNLDHFFITADSSEAAAIDNGSAGPGWSRTGNTFKSGGSTSVCRFYGSQSPGPNSHFYTANAGECDYLKLLQASTPTTQKRWNLESLDFLTTVPVNGACPNGTTSIYRAYNNGFDRNVDSNHRIANSQAAIQEVVNRGWKNEGMVMCAPQ